MKAEDLKQKQEELFEQIKRHADLLGLSGRNWHPIQDGVYNVEEYLKAPIRIMWVMKEAYDGEDEKGNPCGGEWSIFDIIDEGKPFPKSWSNIIYTTYGIFKGWNKIDMYSIAEDPSMKKVMEQIAYVNLNKMPAHKTSSDESLEKCYSQWRSILNAQIELYKPEAIIFGNTFKYFKDDLIGTDEIQPLLDNVGRNTQLYIKNGEKLVDACHPAAIGVSNYVDSIISFFIE